MLNKRYTKVKTLLTAFFVLLVLLPTLTLTFVLIASFQREEVENATRSSTELLKQLNAIAYEKAVAVENYIDQMTASAVIQDCLRYINREDAQLSETSAYFNRLTKYISGASFPGNALKNMLVVGKSEVFYRYNEMVYDDVRSLIQENWYADASALLGKSTWIGVTSLPSKLSPDRSLLCISRSVRDTKTWKEIGTLFLAFDQTYFASLLNSGDMQGRVSIFGRKRQLIGSLCSDEALPALSDEVVKRAFDSPGSGSFHLSIDRRPYLIVYTAPNAMGWRTVRLMHISALTAGAVKNLPMMLAALAVCLVVFVSFLALSYRRISVPLQYMANLFNEMEMMGEIDISRLRSLELATIGTSVLSLVRKQRETDLSLKGARKQKEMEELRRIQAQLNPHFLYNTLSTMALMAQDCGRPEVGELLSDLRVILKNMMSRRSDVITVRDEVEALRSYIAIENAVYQGNIAFDLTIDPEVEQLMVSSFLLQPLVENAVYHGVDPTRPGGRVEVRAWREGEDLFFTVGDNGRGMTQEELMALRDGQKQRASAGMSGLGFYGVHRKLQLMYGAAFGLSVHSEPGGGTSVTARLPAVEPGKEEDNA